jgi:tetratricopeptide (TPR) repeat protein
LRAERWYWRGLAYYGLDQDDKALADFSTAINAINKFPTRLRASWVIWFQRGQTYYRLRQMDKAIADLTRVISENPSHSVSLHARGMAYAELGDLKKAADDFAAALQRANAPEQAWCDVALARLHLGDASGYRECCARALERFGVRWGEDPVMAGTLAWTCSLAPGATADPQQIVILAAQASNGRMNYACRRAEGAALYRADQYEHAITQLDGAAKMRQEPSPSVWLFLSMAHHQLNHREEALKWLNQAVTWIEEAPGREAGDDKTLSWQKLPWNERLGLTLLQREAMLLMGRATYLDLQPRANLKLTESYGNKGNDLTSLPTGEQIFAGVPFKIGKGLIQLSGKESPDKPKQAEGIEVNLNFSKLHILHAAQWRGKDNTRIGYYTVHYEDKRQETIPIVYGKDVLDWWYTEGSPDPKPAKVAWKGDNADAKNSGARIRLYLTTWNNPAPGRKVVSIDFHSTNSDRSAPFCVAMTAQE